MLVRSLTCAFARLLGPAAGALGMITVLAAVPGAQTHGPGTDHWTHAGGPPVLDEADFTAFPIPPGFFAPGSDPFNGIVALGGSVLGPGNADTSQRRLASATLPPPFPVMDTIPIELVQLSLVSVNPITVTYSGGFPETWNVKVCTLPPPAPGSGTLRKTHPNGGTFDSVFPVQPRFTFTRISDGAVRNLPTNGVLQILGPWLETGVSGGVSTGPNFYPGDCTLSFIESGSGSLVLRGGLAPAVVVLVPAFAWVHVLGLGALAALGLALLLTRPRTT